MKIFISWSGERAQQFAQLLHEWIPEVIQRTDTWYSPKMERGTAWFSEILHSVNASDIGIVCVTPENQDSPWLLFEAGALLKKFDGTDRVCPLAIGMAESDIKPPLGSFNISRIDKGGMFDLILTISRQDKDPMAEAALRKQFDRCWPDFDQKAKAILQFETAIATIKRTPEEIMAEVLDNTRALLRDREDRDSRAAISELAEALIGNRFGTNMAAPNTLGWFSSKRVPGYPDNMPSLFPDEDK